MVTVKLKNSKFISKIILRTNLFFMKLKRIFKRHHNQPLPCLFGIFICEWPHMKGLLTIYFKFCLISSKIWSRRISSTAHNSFSLTWKVKLQKYQNNSCWTRCKKSRKKWKLVSQSFDISFQRWVLPREKLVFEDSSNFCKKVIPKPYGPTISMACIVKVHAKSSLSEVRSLNWNDVRKLTVWKDSVQEKKILQTWKDNAPRSHPLSSFAIKIAQKMKVFHEGLSKCDKLTVNGKLRYFVVQWKEQIQSDV